MYHLRREKVSENKKIPPIYQIEGEKLVLNLVFNFNRQKEKDTANGFFSVSCALIFICKDYW